MTNTLSSLVMCGALKYMHTHDQPQACVLQSGSARLASKGCIAIFSQ